MDGLHVSLAFLAGGGWCLAWGYRTALHVSLGRERAPKSGASPSPTEPSRNALVAKLTPQQERNNAEYLR